MQRAPVDRDLAAADPKKTAEIDNGRAHLPRGIDDDIDDTTHVLAIGALYGVGQGFRAPPSINDCYGRFAVAGGVQSWISIAGTDLRQSYETDRQSG